MNRLRIVFLLLALVAPPASPVLAQAAAAGSLPAVTVTRAGAAGLAPVLRYTGTVTAERDAALSPRVAGLVAAVLAEDGDAVKRGTVLLELDATLAQLTLAQARAALQEARARLAEQERLRDDAAALAAASNIAQTQALTLAAEADIAAATVVRLEAEAARAAEIVARHRLVAPFDGIVRRRLVEVGEWVDTSAPVLELVTLGPVRFDVQVPQERYPAIAVNQQVAVELDALPGVRFAGTVRARVPASDPASRTFLVRVVLEGTDGRVIPGMSGQASFRLPATTGVTVPRDAVLRGTDGALRVWTVVADDEANTGKASARIVTTGAAQDGRVEIRSGLDAGALVVVRGNEGLREGQAVRILPGD